MKNRIEEIGIIQDNWLRASIEIGFKINCPFTIILEGKQQIAFAFLPNYGSKKGMVVDLTFPPDFDVDDKIIRWAKSNGCYYSFLNIERYLYYDKDLFIETLDDWGKFNGQKDQV